MKVLDSYECEGQMSMFDLYGPDIWYGRTSQVRYQAPEKTNEGKTSAVYLKRFAELRIKTPQYLDLRKGNGVRADASWEMGGALLGAYTTLSFGESPSDVVESRLSQILEDHPHPKYCLSAKACQGILNRAERRGKALPPLLKEALENQVRTLSRSGGGCERDSSGKRAGKGALVQTELSATLGVSQDQTLIESVSGNIAGTLDANYWKGCGERAGVEREVVAVLEGNGSRDSHRGDGYNDSDTMYTLNTVEQHAVCVGNGQLAQARLSDKVGALNCMHDQQAVMTYAFDRAAYNQGKNAQYDFSVEEELAQTLVSKGPGGGINDKVGALCARDYKGVGSQYVNEGKCVIQNIRR